MVCWGGGDYYTVRRKGGPTRRGDPALRDRPLEITTQITQGELQSISIMPQLLRSSGPASTPA